MFLANIFKHKDPSRKLCMRYTLKYGIHLNEHKNTRYFEFVDISFQTYFVYLCQKHNRLLHNKASCAE